MGVGMLLRASDKSDGCSSEAGWRMAIAMVDHFKLDVGSANTYMALELPKLHRLWLKEAADGYEVCGE